MTLEDKIIKRVGELTTISTANIRLVDIDLIDCTHMNITFKSTMGSHMSSPQEMTSKIKIKIGALI